MALEEHEKLGGTDLLDNRLIIKLQRYNSAMLSASSSKSVPYVSRRRRKTYQVARAAVHVLYTLSTSITPGPAVGLVRVKLPTLIFFSDFFHTVISTRECHLCRNPYPSYGKYHLVGFIGQALMMSIVFRRSRIMSALATMSLVDLFELIEKNSSDDSDD
jgi:hypothetical protein